MRMLLIALALAVFGISPVYAAANTHCYNINGKMVCCTTMGNYTSCT